MDLTPVYDYIIWLSTNKRNTLFSSPQSGLIGVVPGLSSYSKMKHLDWAGTLPFISFLRCALRGIIGGVFSLSDPDEYTPYLYSVLSYALYAEH